MNSKDTIKIEEEKILSQEPELLVKYITEMQSCDTICGRKLTPADKIAHALMDITSLYAQAIKNTRGGWTCGTHMNHVRIALSHAISSKYSDKELLRFIDSCVNCSEGWESLQNGDSDTRYMMTDFLSMRPEPLVHPPASWWRQVLEEEN